MKKAVSLVLALVLTMSLCVSAFALTLAPAAGKESVAAGEDVTITLTLDEAIEEISAAEARLYYNDTLFTYKGCAGAQTGITAVAESEYITLNYIDMTGRGNIAAGTFATLTFTAKSDIREDASAEFSSQIVTALLVDETKSATTELSKMSVTVTPAPAVKGYAVAASAANPAINVGEDAQVALRITNNDAERYNAYYMEISYDSAKLTYKGINTDASVTNNGGTLKIAGYGADKACGTDDIVLTFTGKSTGEAKVTVASAKVDAKANAVENDAPAASVTAAEAVITVGGHQVTLPDDFTGAATAESGKSYTFTAKDTSKKYDFTGSTMNGETVTVKDNGDGTYTVENVTGALEIKATAMVTVHLDNQTDAFINGLTDGQTVKPGTAITFMAIDMTGKELVTTVNGEVLAPDRVQTGRYNYTIPAAQVTGDALNVVISYKAEDKATIIEDGDWADVVYRSGWTKSGDQVAAGTNLNFTMNQQEGYTYTVTVNGTVLTGMVRPGSNTYTYSIDGATYVKAGETTTIHITKTAVQPAYTVTVSEYLKLDGRSVFLITAAGDVAEGKLLAYDGNAMYWSEKYNEGKGAYVWLVSSDKPLAEVQAEETAAKLAVIDANETNKVSVSYNGDVNLTGAADINDAQLVWNMYNAEYKDDTAFQTVNRLKYLSADMNADGKLDTTDAAAIVAALIKQ